MKRKITIMLLIFCCVFSCFLPKVGASSWGINVNNTQTTFTYGGVEYIRRDYLAFDYIQFSKTTNGVGYSDLHNYFFEVPGWNTIANNGELISTNINTLEHSSYSLSSELSYEYNINSSNLAGNLRFDGLLNYEATINSNAFNPRYMWVMYTDNIVQLNDLLIMSYSEEEASQEGTSYTKRELAFNFGEATTGIRATAYYNIDVITDGGVVNYRNDGGVVYKTLNYTNNSIGLFPDYYELETIVASKWSDYANYSTNTYIRVNKLLILIDFGASGLSNGTIATYSYPLITNSYYQATYSFNTIVSKLVNASTQEAFNSGYTAGFNEGAKTISATGWLGGIFRSIGDFLAIEILPGLSFGLIVSVPLCLGLISLILVFWRKD